MSHTDGFTICIFTGNDVLFRINGKSCRACKGDILVLAPNTIMECASPGFTGETLRITAPIDLVMELPSPFDTDIVAAARRFPLIRPSEAESEWIGKMYAMLVQAYADGDGMYRREILKSLIFAIIYKLGEIYERLDAQMPAGTKLNDERLSDDFFRLLARYFRTDRTVKFYASRMALTPKYLSKAIRRITGKSVREWVDEAIVLEIKNLLKTTDMTVLQISEELHFS
ncbi:MAG: helix-turn-helix domain-containing protein, partial [Candidatus Cryptobacteroides sp.]